MPFRQLAYALPDTLLDAGIGALARARVSLKKRDSLQLRNMQAHGCPLLVLGQGPGLDYLMRHGLPECGLSSEKDNQPDKDPISNAMRAIDTGAVALGRIHQADAWRLTKLNPVFFPELVDAAIDTPLADHLRPPGKSARETLRSVKRNGLTWQYSNKTASFERFYHDMYLPAARAQFRDAAVIRSKARLRLEFWRGFLVEIRNNEQVIAAEIISKRGDELSRIACGVIDDGGKSRSLGALGAFYLAAFEQARALGCSTVNAGGSLPSMVDPTLRNKQDWGAVIKPRGMVDHFLFMAWSKQTPLASLMIERLQPIATHLGGFAALRLAGSPPLREYRTAGLAGVVSLDENDLSNSGRVAELVHAAVANG